MNNDYTTDPAIASMLTRWRETLPPELITPALLEAAATPPNATMIERSEAAGAVAACMWLRHADKLDISIAQAERADQHAAQVGQVLEARGGVEPERIRELTASAWIWCQSGFMRRVQRALVELAAGRSLVDQGIVVAPAANVGDNSNTA